MSCAPQDLPVGVVKCAPSPVYVCNLDDLQTGSVGVELTSYTILCDSADPAIFYLVWRQLSEDGSTVEQHYIVAPANIEATGDLPVTAYRCPDIEVVPECRMDESVEPPAIYTRVTAIDPSGSVVYTVWLGDDGTAVSPPASTAPCQGCQNLIASGPVCYELAPGEFGKAWVFHDCDGIASLADVVTGAQVSQSSVVDCPQATVSTSVLCDDTGQFIRHVVHSAAGAAIASYDTLLDGTTPYTHVGNVSLCVVDPVPCQEEGRARIVETQMPSEAYWNLGASSLIDGAAGNYVVPATDGAGALFRGGEWVESLDTLQTTSTGRFAVTNWVLDFPDGLPACATVTIRIDVRFTATDVSDPQANTEPDAFMRVRRLSDGTAFLPTINSTPQLSDSVPSVSTLSYSATLSAADALDMILNIMVQEQEGVTHYGYRAFAEAAVTVNTDGCDPVDSLPVKIVCKPDEYAASPVVLCDDGVQFLRHIIYDAAGSPSRTVSTTLDGVTPYIPVGTVSVCREIPVIDCEGGSSEPFAQSPVSVRPTAIIPPTPTFGTAYDLAQLPDWAGTLSGQPVQVLNVSTQNYGAAWNGWDTGQICPSADVTNVTISLRITPLADFDGDTVNDFIIKVTDGPGGTTYPISVSGDPGGGSSPFPNQYLGGWGGTGSLEGLHDFQIVLGAVPLVSIPALTLDWLSQRNDSWVLENLEMVIEFDSSDCAAEPLPPVESVPVKVCSTSKTVTDCEGTASSVTDYLGAVSAVGVDGGPLLVRLCPTCENTQRTSILCADGAQAVPTSAGGTYNLADGEQVSQTATLDCNGNLLRVSSFPVSDPSVELSGFMSLTVCESEPEIVGPRCVRDANGDEWASYDLVQDGLIVSTFYVDQAGDTGTPAGAPSAWSGCSPDIVLCDSGSAMLVKSCDVDWEPVVGCLVEQTSVTIGFSWSVVGRQITVDSSPAIASSVDPIVYTIIDIGIGIADYQGPPSWTKVVTIPASTPPGVYEAHVWFVTASNLRIPAEAEWAWDGVSVTLGSVGTTALPYSVAVSEAIQHRALDGTQIGLYSPDGSPLIPSPSQSFSTDCQRNEALSSFVMSAGIGAVPPRRQASFSAERIVPPGAPTVPPNTYSMTMYNDSAGGTVMVAAGADTFIMPPGASLSVSRDPASEQPFPAGAATVSLVSGAYVAGDALVCNYKAVV